MVVTMLCTMATQSWVVIEEMGFSPSILTLQVSPTWETSNHVGLTEQIPVSSLSSGEWQVLKE